MATHDNESLVKTAAALKSVSILPERVKDGELQLCLETSWENYLVPAPMCIALMGQVQLVATARDFSMVDSAPEGGFKFIKYPRSFRASLVNLTNQGWNAFDTAHRNMQQISLTAGQIPDKIQEVFKTMVKGSAMEIRELLPMMLDKITEDAKNCEVLAKTADSKFGLIMDLTAELVEVCTQQKGLTEKQLQEARATLTAKTELSKTLEIQVKNREQQVKDLHETMKRADANFQRALSQMPTGWELIGMDFVEALSKTVTNTIDRAIDIGLPLLITAATGNPAIGMAIGASLNAPKSSEGGSATTKPAAAATTAAAAGGKGGNFLGSLGNILGLVDLAVGQAPQITSLIRGLTTMDTTKEDKRGPEFIIGMLGVVASTLSGMPQSDKTTKLQGIISQSTKIAQNLSALSGAPASNPEVKKLQKQAEEVLAEAQQVEATAQLAHGKQFAPTISPGQFGAITEAASSGKLTAGQVAQKNWELSMQVTTQAAQDAQRRYDESMANLEQMQMKHAELMGDMAKLRLDEIDFDTIVTVLKQGIMALSDLRVQWSAMTYFFSMLSAITVQSNEHIKTLAERSEKLASIKLASGGNLSGMSTDMLFELCLKADQVARVVQMISWTYVQVSEKYVLGPMASLNKIAGLDANDAKLVHDMQGKLLSESQAAQAAIMGLVKDEKAKFKRQLDARRGKVQDTFRSLITPPKEVEETVKEAAKEINKGREEAKAEKTKVVASTGLDPDFLGN